MSLLSSMITLPPSSAKGLYQCWYSRVASPTSSSGLSPPVSPPGSPRPSSLMIALPAGSANGFHSWQHYTEVASPTGSGSLSPAPMSRPTTPIHLPPISEVFGQRASWPVSSLSISDRQNSDRDGDHSRPTSMATSVSYSYTVRSVDSRKSRLTVLYPRPVRPRRASGVESIPESAATSLESFSPLSSRPVSMSVSVSVPLQGNSTPVTDNEVSLWTRVPTDGRVVIRVAYLQRQHVTDVMEALSALFESCPQSSFQDVERRLSASWKSLLRIKAYEEIRSLLLYPEVALCL
jgi:hypothetical protein